MQGDSTFRRILHVATGAAIGQLLMIAASPVLTRLFSPADFGFFGVYLSIVSIIGSVSAFRYDVAGSVSKSQRLADLLFQLAVFCCFSVSALVFFVALVGESMEYALLCALSVLFFGLFQAATYVAVRSAKFKYVGLARALQGGGGVLAQLCCGLVASDGLGLLVGFLVGLFLATLYLWNRLGLSFRLKTLFIFRLRYSFIAFKFQDFALKAMPATLIGTAGLFAPNILFTQFYGTSVAGSYVLAQRVVVLPMHFIGMAVAQVYLNKLASAYHERNIRFYSLVKTASLRLFLVGLFPTLFLCAFGQDVFGLVFGADWRLSGFYASILVWAFLLQLISSPLSNVFVVAGRQTLQLSWEIGRVCVVFVSIFFSSVFNMSSEFAVAMFSCVLAISYLIQLWLIMRTAKACSLRFDGN